MRFVSQHKGYHIALRPAATNGYDPHGEPIITKPAMNGEFRQLGLAPWEYQEVLDHWEGRFTGLADGVDPRSCLSVFDTEWAQEEYGWTDEERKFAEQKLLTLPGRLGNEYIQVEVRKTALPWPSYKTFNSPERIVSFMREGGVDPEIVLTYERENLNREDVLDAVENAGHEDVVEHEVVVKA